MSQTLIDAVYRSLALDETFTGYFGLSPSSPPEQVAKRIIKGMEPEQALTGASVPQVMVYIKPGRMSRNYLVFEGKFCLDVYGKTSSEARKLAERAYRLFHDRNITDPAFRSYRCFLAYDGDFATGITGVKGYSAIYDVDYLRMN